MPKDGFAENQTDEALHAGLLERIIRTGAGTGYLQVVAHNVRVGEQSLDGTFVARVGFAQA